MIYYTWRSPYCSIDHEECERRILLFTFQDTWLGCMQEIASATEGDKKKAKKKAAQRAIQFLLDHSGPSQPLPTHDAASMGNHPSIPQPSSSGLSCLHSLSTKLAYTGCSVQPFSLVKELHNPLYQCGHARGCHNAAADQFFINGYCVDR